MYPIFSEIYSYNRKAEGILKPIHRGEDKEAEEAMGRWRKILNDMAISQGTVEITRQWKKIGTDSL